MRIQALIIGLTILGQVSCSDSEIAIDSLKDNSSQTSLNGTWKVISFEDYNLNTVEVKDQANSWGLDIVVTFDDTSTPSVLSGKNTTNTIAGDFNYTGIRKFKVNLLNTTKVAQPVWANKFSEAILDTNISYNISGSELTVYYDNNTKNMKLKRE